MMPSLVIALDTLIQTRYPGVLLGVGIIRDLAETPKRRILEGEIASTSQWLRQNFSLEKLKDEPNCRAYRDFYWKMNTDPTKQRPAAEALARRILHGESLPRINPIVDAYNLASLKTLIAIGAYDLANTGRALTLRFSREGELFEPIGGKSEVLRAGRIVLADENRIMHVYPYRDSKLTSVSESTLNVLILSAGVPGLLGDRVLEAARLACENIVRICGGRIEDLRVLG